MKVMSMPNNDRYRQFGYTESTYPQTLELEVFRERYDGSLIGYEQHDFSETSSFATTNNFMIDVTGNRSGDNGLLFRRSSMNPATARFNSVAIRDYPMFDYRSRRVYNCSVTTQVPGDLMDLDGEILQDDIEFITQAAAKTNPSSAEVQGLVFLAELRSLPSLIQSAGHTLSKFGANEYLKYQYGWRPLIKDVKKMMDIVSKVKKRIAVIQRLQAEGTFRSNHLSSDNPYGIKEYRETGEAFEKVYTQGGTLSFNLERRLKVKRWAQIIWKPEAPERGWWNPSDDRHFESARNAVYGLNLDGPSLWQAMPWSWLVDWTANCSDFVKSQNNTVGAKYERSVLMRASRSVVVSDAVFTPDVDHHSISLSASPGTYFGVDKVRITDLNPAVVNTNDFGEIISSDFKVSILGALGIQRLRGL